MLMFLLGISVTINIVFIIMCFVLYKDYKMKMFLKRTTKKDFGDW